LSITQGFDGLMHTFFVSTTKNQHNQSSNLLSKFGSSSCRTSCLEL